MSSCLVLFSGGQDSTTCLYWAKQNFNKVKAIGFDYGQKHEVELQVAHMIADQAEVEFELVDLKGVFVGSSLVDHSQDVAAAHNINISLPSSFTAGRNAVFLSVAAGRAYQGRISDLVTGVCQTDYSGYPDCRRNFIDSMEQSLALALEKKIKIHTPLMYKTKAETWKLAKDLGCLSVVVEQSHTDYNGNREQFNEWGYGSLDNPASELRAKGFYEARENGWI
jgi:7-cyano-7-deazaguanine synthase